MTRYQALLATSGLALAACAHKAQPPASPAPAQPTSSPATPQVVTGTITTISADSFERLRRSLPPPSAAELAWRKRIDSLDALVDTIVIASPDSILLHVGQVFDMATVQYEARRASGERLPTYSGSVDISDRSIVRFNDAGLLALQAGRTCVVFTVIHDRVRTHPTCLAAHVLP